MNYSLRRRAFELTSSTDIALYVINGEEYASPALHQDAIIRTNTMILTCTEWLVFQALLQIPSITLVTQRS